MSTPIPAIKCGTRFPPASLPAPIQPAPLTSFAPLPSESVSAQPAEAPAASKRTATTASYHFPYSKKLTAFDVECVFALSADGVSQRAIARLFEVSQAAIWQVLSGKVWARLWVEVDAESDAKGSEATELPSGDTEGEGSFA